MPSSIPAGWQETRIGKIAREISARNRDAADIPVLSVTKHNGFVRSSEYFSRSVHSEDTSNYKIVRKGQFAYATIHLEEGSIALLKDFEDGLISPMYTVFEVSSALVCSDYLFRCLKRFALSGRFDPYSNGGVNRRKSISFGDLKAFRFALPPLAEQRAIAEVLGAVDDAIAKMEALIEAISSFRDAIVLGFDGNSRGRTREVRLGTIAKSLDAGVSVNSEKRQKFESEFGVLKTSAASFGTFRPDEHKAVLHSERSRTSTPVRGDCIILSRMNTPELVGASVYVDRDYPDLYLPDRLWLLDVKDRDIVNVRWLALVLASKRFRSRFSALATGTSGTMKNLSKKLVLSLKINLPPIIEQKRVAALASALDEKLLADTISLDQLKSTHAALAQELLSGRIRLPDSMIARHRDKPERAA